MVRVTDGFVLSNLRSTTTGVEGAILWVAAGEFDDADRTQGPRIMVVLGDNISADRLKDAVVVLLTKAPVVMGSLPGEIERQVVAFVEANREVLLRYWTGEMSTREMIELVQPIKARR